MFLWLCKALLLACLFFFIGSCCGVYNCTIYHIFYFRIGVHKCICCAVSKMLSCQNLKCGCLAASFPCALPGGERERLRHRAVSVPPEAYAFPRASELSPYVQARGVHFLQERPHGDPDGLVRDNN